MKYNYFYYNAYFSSYSFAVNRILIIGVFIMNQGHVKWFNESKGFGFIQKENGEDIFVHHTGIIADGYKTLTEGAKVEFQIEQTDKGPRAVSVKEL